MSAGRRGLGHSVVSGLLWMMWGKGGHALLHLLSVVILARLLTPREFGAMGAAMLVLEASAIFSRLGFGPAIVQRKELEPRHLRTAFWGSIALGIVFGAGIWLLAPIGGRFFGDPLVAPILRTLAWVFPLKGASTLAEALLLRELRFRWIANAEVALFAVAQVGISVMLAWAGFGVWALVGGTLAYTVLRTALYLLASRPPIRGLPEYAALVEMLHYGGGFTAGRLANLLALQGDNLVVGHWMGPVALGLYSRAYNLMSAPASVVGKVLDDVLFPTMAKLQDDVERLARAYRRGTAAIALLMMPASAAAVVLGPEIVRVALGTQWMDAVVPFQILAAGTVFRTSYKMSDSLARSTGLVYRRAYRQVLYAALVLAGSYVGRSWGLAGVAVGVLLAVIANFLLMLHLSLAVCRLRWSEIAAVHRPAALLAAISAATAWGAAALLRQLGASAPVTLVGAAAAAAVGVVATVVASPGVALGPEGRWILSTLAARVTSRNPGGVVAERA